MLQFVAKHAYVIPCVVSRVGVVPVPHTARRAHPKEIVMDEPQIDRTHFGVFGRLKRRAQTLGVVVHHTCTATPERTRKALLAQGYSTHFEIDRDGHIYQYAELDRKCNHCGGNNHRYIGVDLTHPAGAPWPAAQIDAARVLFRWLAAKYDLPWVYYDDPPSGFRSHRSACVTECPQDFPYWEIFCGGSCEETK